MLAWKWSLQAALGWLLRLAGPVPAHVAFIMDGNRRFADRRHMPRVAGHRCGYDKLLQVMEWCLAVGVEYVSVYAFSIDNLKRSEEEVAYLMGLANEKYKEMVQDDGIVSRKQLRVRVVGDLSLTSPALRSAAEQVTGKSSTVERPRATVNICFSYTSTQEMLAAVAETQADTAGPFGSDRSDEALLDSFESHLQTLGSPPVDLLIRTSDECRLSDFMLWQSRKAMLEFVRPCWPDLSFWDFMRSLLQYQRAAMSSVSG